MAKPPLLKPFTPTFVPSTGRFAPLPSRMEEPEEVEEVEEVQEAPPKPRPAPKPKKQPDPSAAFRKQMEDMSSGFVQTLQEDLTLTRERADRNRAAAYSGPFQVAAPPQEPERDPEEVKMAALAKYVKANKDSLSPDQVTLLAQYIQSPDLMPEYKSDEEMAKNFAKDFSDYYTKAFDVGRRAAQEEPEYTVISKDQHGNEYEIPIYKSGLSNEIAGTVGNHAQRALLIDSGTPEDWKVVTEGAANTPINRAIAKYYAGDDKVQYEDLISNMYEPQRDTLRMFVYKPVYADPTGRGGINLHTVFQMARNSRFAELSKNKPPSQLSKEDRERIGQEAIEKAKLDVERYKALLTDSYTFASNQGRLEDYVAGRSHFGIGSLPILGVVGMAFAPNLNPRYAQLRRPDGQAESTATEGGLEYITSVLGAEGLSQSGFVRSVDDLMRLTMFSEPVAAAEMAAYREWISKNGYDKPEGRGAYIRKRRREILWHGLMQNNLGEERQLLMHQLGTEYDNAGMMLVHGGRIYRDQFGENHPFISGITDPATAVRAGVMWAEPDALQLVFAGGGALLGPAGAAGGYALGGIISEGLNLTKLDALSAIDDGLIRLEKAIDGIDPTDTEAIAKALEQVRKEDLTGQIGVIDRLAADSIAKAERAASATSSAGFMRTHIRNLNRAAENTKKELVKLQQGLDDLRNAKTADEAADAATRTMLARSALKDAEAARLGADLSLQTAQLGSLQKQRAAIIGLKYLTEKGPIGKRLTPAKRNEIIKRLTGDAFDDAAVQRWLQDEGIEALRLRKEAERLFPGGKPKKGRKAKAEIAKWKKDYESFFHKTLNVDLDARLTKLDADIARQTTKVENRYNKLAKKLVPAKTASEQARAQKVRAEVVSELKKRFGADAANKAPTALAAIRSATKTIIRRTRKQASESAKALAASKAEIDAAKKITDNFKFGPDGKVTEAVGEAVLKAQQRVSVNYVDYIKKLRESVNILKRREAARLTIGGKAIIPGARTGPEVLADAIASGEKTVRTQAKAVESQLEQARLAVNAERLLTPEDTLTFLYEVAKAMESWSAIPNAVMTLSRRNIVDMGFRASMKAMFEGRGTAAGFLKAAATNKRTSLQFTSILLADALSAFNFLKIKVGVLGPRFAKRINEIATEQSKETNAIFSDLSRIMFLVKDDQDALDMLLQYIGTGDKVTLPGRTGRATEISANIGLGAIDDTILSIALENFVDVGRTMPDVATKAGREAFKMAIQKSPALHGMVLSMVNTSLFKVMEDEGRLYAAIRNFTQALDSPIVKGGAPAYKAVKTLEPVAQVRLVRNLLSDAITEAGLPIQGTKVEDVTGTKAVQEFTLANDSFSLMLSSIVAGMTEFRLSRYTHNEVGAGVGLRQWRAVTGFMGRGVKAPIMTRATIEVGDTVVLKSDVASFRRLTSGLSKDKYSVVADASRKGKTSLGLFEQEILGAAAAGRQVLAIKNVNGVDVAVLQGAGGKVEEVPLNTVSLRDAELSIMDVTDLYINMGLSLVGEAQIVDRMDKIRGHADAFRKNYTQFVIHSFDEAGNARVIPQVELGRISKNLEDFVKEVRNTISPRASQNPIVGDFLRTVDKVTNFIRRMMLFGVAGEKSPRFYLTNSTGDFDAMVVQIGFKEAAQLTLSGSLAWIPYLGKPLQDGFRKNAIERAKAGKGFTSVFSSYMNKVVDLVLEGKNEVVELTVKGGKKVKINPAQLNNRLIRLGVDESWANMQIGPALQKAARREFGEGIDEAMRYTNPGVNDTTLYQKYWFTVRETTRMATRRQKIHTYLLLTLERGMPHDEAVRVLDRTIFDYAHSIGPAEARFIAKLSAFYVYRKNHMLSNAQAMFNLDQAGKKFISQVFSPFGPYRRARAKYKFTDALLFPGKYERPGDEMSRRRTDIEPSEQPPDWAQSMFVSDIGALPPEARKQMRKLKQNYTHYYVTHTSSIPSLQFMNMVSETNALLMGVAASALVPGTYLNQKKVYDKAWDAFFDQLYPYYKEPIEKTVEAWFDSEDFQRKGRRLKMNEIELMALTGSFPWFMDLRRKTGLRPTPYKVEDGVMYAGGWSTGFGPFQGALSPLGASASVLESIRLLATVALPEIDLALEAGGSDFRVAPGDIQIDRLTRPEYYDTKLAGLDISSRVEALRRLINEEKMRYYNPDDNRGYEVREADKIIRKDFQTYEGIGKEEQELTFKNIYGKD